MVLASALEPLRVAQKLVNGPDFTWETATLFDQPVRSSSRLTISPSIKLADLNSTDYLVLVSGYGVREHSTSETFLKLHQLRKISRHVIGVDTGAWLMASAGILDGTQATIHWQEVSAFRETFPNVLFTNEDFVLSGPYFTCGSASAVMDMTLQLIKDRYGAAVAFDASNMFVSDVKWKFSMPKSGTGLRNTGSSTLRLAVNVMVDNIEHPVSLAALAEAASSSVRSLNRIFLRELQMSPGKYYQLLRLGRAHDIAVETNQSISQIAFLTGFSSASALSRAFLQHYGVRISSVRKRR